MNGYSHVPTGSPQAARRRTIDAGACHGISTVPAYTSHPTLDLNQYGFQTEVRVRLNETDAVGVVFFGQFANYMDVGRMDYLAHLGLQRLDGAVRDLIPGMVVHQEVRYRSPARYNDVLLIHVRVADIGRTSYTLHFLLTQKRNRQTVATGSVTLIWMNNDWQVTPVPQEFRRTVEEFEQVCFTSNSQEQPLVEPQLEHL